MNPPLKVIINVDPKTGESDNFLWKEKEDPPPLIRPKRKPKPGQDKDKEKEKPS